MSRPLTPPHPGGPGGVSAALDQGQGRLAPPAAAGLQVLPPETPARPAPSPAARLRPTDWLVLLLRRQGWRVGAIATALGVSPSCIAQRLHRARFALGIRRSSKRLLEAVPWQQCPADAQVAAERLLARWRQGPPPAPERISSARTRQEEAHAAS
ncbi:helix-turn-helix domain-containing protein [Thermogemmatispora sp.]|uniref:helix-turn-helix domain-containing protein n=1 Tax=Thermogemmatispora sp. TaxID=1968838 RepID=UPI0035E423AD